MTDLDQRPIPFYTGNDFAADGDEEYEDEDYDADEEEEMEVAESATPTSVPVDEDAATLNRLQQQAADLASMNQQSSDALLEMGESLREVYDQASSLLGNDDPAIVAQANRTMELVTSAWERGGSLVEQTAKLQAAHAAALTLAAKIQQRVAETTGELANLVHAVQSLDDNHPLVSELIETVEESALEYFAEQESYYNEDIAYDALVEEFGIAFNLKDDEASSLLDRIRSAEIHEAFITAAQAELGLPDFSEDED